MAQAGTITVDAVLQSAQFAGQLERLERRIGGLDTTFSKTARNITRSLTAVGAALGGGAIVTGINAIIDSADKLGDQAAKVNTTAEALQGLRLASEDAGGSAEAMDRALGELQKRLGEAVANGGEAAKAFARLGLSARDLAGRGTEEAFLAVADSIAALGSNAERAAAAQAVFGKGGQELLPLLNEGRAAIEEQLRAFKAMGLVLSNEAVAALGVAEERLRTAKTATMNLASEFVAGLTPAVFALSGGIRTAAQDLGGLQSVGERLSAGLLAAFEIMRNGVLSLQAAFFGLAAAGARALQALTFGDVSEAFAASVDANLEKANAALAEIRSIEQIQQRIVAALEAARAASQADRPNANNVTTAVGDLDPTLRDRVQGAKLDGAIDAQTEIALRQSNEQILKIVEEGEEQKRQAYQQTADFQLQARQEAEAAILSVQAGAINAGIGLLQTLAARSKAAAIALVLVNRGIAIAQAIQNGAVAVTKVLAINPYDVAGVARVKAMTALSVAAITAAGIGDIVNIGSGDAGGISGTTLGTPNNPVYTNNQNGASSPFEEKVLRVEVVGRVTDNAGQVIAELIAKQVKERDIVIIEPGSRNGRELIGPGG